MNQSFWRGRRVLVTGHTGFKGSWLCLWLQSLGAEVYGYALDPLTTPNLFTVASVMTGMAGQQVADVRNAGKVVEVLQATRPEIIFHLAAQPLVRYSYAHPVETYEVNVMGTVNILEAIRVTPSVRALVNVTSDKCYDNRESQWGYREYDPLGGTDPYSSSKGCSELITSAYRRSFLYKADIAVATARAGNVLGGGDWSADRLLPDILRSVESGTKLMIRYPDAIRPWQHVLDPLAGYLMLAEQLYIEGARFSEAWNFGPDCNDVRSVRWIVEYLAASGLELSWECMDLPQPHESHSLMLDSTKARVHLGWKTRWDIRKALEKTISWHKALHRGGDMRIFSLNQISEYGESLAKE